MTDLSNTNTTADIATAHVPQVAAAVDPLAVFATAPTEKEGVMVDIEHPTTGEVLMRWRLARFGGSNNSKIVRVERELKSKLTQGQRRTTALVILTSSPVSIGKCSCVRACWVSRWSTPSSHRAILRSATKWQTQSWKRTLRCTTSSASFRLMSRSTPTLS
jgi:hypothetical protein